MNTLILASTSRFRRALMDRMKLPYKIVAPEFEECIQPGEPPLEYAKRFALGKAQAVAEKNPNAWVIGADQALDFEGKTLRKPQTREDAIEQLLELSGRWHQLHSAIALIGPGSSQIEVATTALKMRSLSQEEAKTYVDQDDPIGSIGGYIYEARGFLLFDEIRGSDDSAIVGLPLWLLSRMLREVGFQPGVG